MTFSGAALLSLVTTFRLRRSVEMSASVTIILWLPEQRMGRGVSLSSLSLNLSTLPLVVPLMKLCRIQENVSQNQKGLLRGLLWWYAPSSWWRTVTVLVNIYDAWWICASVDSPSSPPKNRALQAPSPPPCPSAIFLEIFPLWGRNSEVSR